MRRKYFVDEPEDEEDNLVEDIVNQEFDERMAAMVGMHRGIVKYQDHRAFSYREKLSFLASFTPSDDDDLDNDDSVAAQLMDSLLHKR